MTARRELLRESGWAVLRVAAGLSLATHGWAKVFGTTPDGRPMVEAFAEGVSKLGFPAPAFFAWCAALAELGGGVLVALGLGARPAAAFAAFTMAVALFRHREDPFARMELALLYFVVMLAVVLGGAGRFSLDREISTRAGRKPPA